MDRKFVDLYIEGQLNGKIPDHDSPEQDVIRMYTDSYFRTTGTIFARDLAKASKAPVYEYVFSHDPIFGFPDLIGLGIMKHVVKVLVIILRCC